MTIKERIETALISIDYARASHRQVLDLHALKSLVTRFMCRQYLQQEMA